MSETRHLIVTTRGQSTRYPLVRGRDLVIGRAQNCDIQVDHKRVSRRHALIRVDASVSVEDLGSQNGSVVLVRSASNQTESQTVKETLLAPNVAHELVADAMLQIGPALFTLEIGDVSPLVTKSLTPDDVVVLDPEMKTIFELTARIAGSDLSVLILGESGVGKEVLARFIHAQSPRFGSELVTLNCGALPENLLESELFGYEKGAFSGAAKSTPGLIELADRGTLFFDEVGELAPSLQVKLLRVLEAKQSRRVGGRRSIDVDVRFIAATNRNLEGEVAAGRFREDLFYRLNGISFTIPPLRERKSEILPLARRFLESAASDQVDRNLRFSEAAEAKLENHAWPGNVRELKNVVRRAAVLATGVVVEAPLIQLPDASGGEPFAQAQPIPSLRDEPTSPTTSSNVSELRAAAEAAERQQVLDALEACAGNQTRAAKMLGLSRRSLITMLERHKIPRPRKGRNEP